MKIKFTRDGETLAETSWLSGQELPRPWEIVSLPGSRRKHQVLYVHKKISRVRGAKRFVVNQIEIALGPAPKGA